MSKKKYTLIVYVATVLLALGIGFLLGRSMIEQQGTVTKIKYVKGDKITDTIEKPIPYAVKSPVDTADIIRQCVRDGIYMELFPEKIDIQYITVTNEDTLAIIRDWGTLRKYKETLFNSDTIGRCEITADVQYNRLLNIGYSYIPIQKEVATITNKVKFFSPFIGAGLTRSHWSETKDWFFNANFGFFIKEKAGLNIQYNRSLYFDTNSIGCSFIYKF